MEEILSDVRGYFFKVGSMMQLYGDERIDYLLHDEKMKIIQSPTVFSYSLDAVLLANFAYMPVNKGNILDLCTGNGAVPLLLSQRTKGQLVGLEIQERLAEMAKRSVAFNDLTDRITIVEGDLTKRQATLQQSFYDVVTCNPPYFSTKHVTQHNVNEHLTIARHEVLCTLSEVVAACKLYVKPGGKVAMVHRPERLIDLLTLFREHAIEPKRMQLVYPKHHKEANMLLLEGVRDGKTGLKVLPPLYIYTENGEYTKEARSIIYGE